MTGKTLSALLQILKSHGVTHYQTPDLTLDLVPKAAQAAPAPIVLTPEEVSLIGEDDKDEEEIGDPRFLLERLSSTFTAKYPAKKAA